MKNKYLALLLIITLANSCSFGPDQFDYSLIPVQIEGKWGYINKQGEFLIQPQFEDASYFSNGLASVKIEGKFGYINKSGQITINPNYKDATYFSENLACTVVEDGYPMYIDKAGKIKFTLSNADKIRIFKENRAAILIKGKWGFIDQNGKIVIEAKYNDVSDFKEGFAVVSEKVNNEIQKGYINKNGLVMINLQFTDAFPFNDGLALVKVEGKWGYINKTGKLAIYPQFNDAYAFSEGMAMIKEDDEYGYINSKGNIEINPQFKNASLFNENLALVRNNSDKYGYINKDGKFAINPQFEFAGAFNEGVAFIRIGDKCGFIDKKGQIIINPQFESVFSWHFSKSYVESDYFDASNFVELFLKNTDQSKFRGIDNQATFRHLVQDEHLGSEYFEGDSFSVIYEDDVPVNEYSTITKLNYKFSSKIYSLSPNYTYSYYYGYYNRGNSKQYNYNSKVSEIIYQIEFNYNAKEKEEKIAIALGERLSEILGSQPSKFSNIIVIENTVMKITITYQSGVSRANIIVEVRFL